MEFCHQSRSCQLLLKICKSKWIYSSSDKFAYLTDSIKKWECKLLFTLEEIHSYLSLKGSAWDSVSQEWFKKQGGGRPSMKENLAQMKIHWQEMKNIDEYFEICFLREILVGQKSSQRGLIRRRLDHLHKMKIHLDDFKRGKPSFKKTFFTK